MGFSVFLGSAVDKIDEGTPISLGAACTCASVIVLGAWWLSRRFGIQDRMHKENLKRFKRLERNMAALQKGLGIQPEPEDADLDNE